MTAVENVGVFIREKVWLENSLSQSEGGSQGRGSFRLAHAIFKPNLFLYEYSNILNPSHSSYVPAYEDGTDSVPKHWHTKFRHRGFTQKKAYNSTILTLMSCLVLYVSVYPEPKGCQIWFSTY